MLEPGKPGALKYADRQILNEIKRVDLGGCGLASAHDSLTPDRRCPSRRATTKWRTQMTLDIREYRARAVEEIHHRDWPFCQQAGGRYRAHGDTCCSVARRWARARAPGFFPPGRQGRRCTAGRVPGGFFGAKAGPRRRILTRASIDRTRAPTLAPRICADEVQVILWSPRTIRSIMSTCSHHSAPAPR